MNFIFRLSSGFSERKENSLGFSPILSVRKFRRCISL